MAVELPIAVFHHLMNSLRRQLIPGQLSTFTPSFPRMAHQYVFTLYTVYLKIIWHLLRRRDCSMSIHMHPTLSQMIHLKFEDRHTGSYCDWETVFHISYKHNTENY